MDDTRHDPRNDQRPGSPSWPGSSPPPGPEQWRQVVLSCSDWRAAEHMGTTGLLPLLTTGPDAAGLRGWWFLRKGPAWRIRLTADRPADAEAAARNVATAIARSRLVDRWNTPPYEPETRRFGGPAGMAIAHELFSAHSRHVLQHLAGTTPDRQHRLELGLLLGTRLIRAAGQDWYELGDVWSLVATHRTPSPGVGPGAEPVAGRAPASAPGTADHRPTATGTLLAVRQLLTAAGDSAHSPLRTHPGWPAAHDAAGRALRGLADAGAPTVRLRQLLAHHLLFLLNQLGIATAHQYVLATAAAAAVFEVDSPPRRPTGSTSRSTTVATVTPVTTSSAAGAGTAHPGPAASEQPDPDAGRDVGANELRAALVAHIDGLGTFRTPAVRRAFEVVERHRFLPEVDLASAYARRAVVTKRDPLDGSALSSASSPNLVAAMLEQLEVRPGQRVLEIGAATGINAALLAELVGPDGQVTTIELDEDLADGARRHLRAAGYGQVRVVCGDGAAGDPAGAPYDRIIVTAGAWDLPAAWWQQLAAGGRIVVPLLLHGSGLTRSLALDLGEPGRLVSSSAQVCGFVPMRGAAAVGQRPLRLAEDVVLHVETPASRTRNNASGDLRTALHHAVAADDRVGHRTAEAWTGVRVGHAEPVEHLDLWLATTGRFPFGRVSVGADARRLGLPGPALRWGGAAVHTSTSFAYLISRPSGSTADELGIAAYGPDAATLSDHLTGELRSWAISRPTQPAIVVEYGSPETPQMQDTRLFRPSISITISWAAHTAAAHHGAVQ